MVKSKKRANGEGSIRQLDDGRWEARLLVTDPITGEKKQLTKSRKTKREVAEWLNGIKAEIHKGMFVGENKITVEDWLKTWLNEYSKPKVRLTTWESYESVVRNHLIPALGKYRLRDLRPEHLQSLYNRKSEQGRMDGKGGLSSTSVKYIHTVINQALKQAVQNDLISRNVAERVKPPKMSKHEITPLTPEQMRVFLKAIQGHKFYCAFLVECYTGLRRGELLGLRWQDVDFKNNRIMVRQSLNNTNQGLIFTECKTKASRRTIPLPLEVMLELKNHKKRQNEERLLAGEAYINKDLLYCNPLGKPLDPVYFVRQFERILSDAELPIIRFHDMRHSHATMLISEGINPKVVQERLGHTTIRMTLDTYSHVLPGMQEQATMTIGKILSSI